MTKQQTEVITGIKKNEIVWVTHYHNNKAIYVITSNKTRETYFLYVVKDNVATKTRFKSSSPDDLNKYIK